MKSKPAIFPALLLSGCLLLPVAGSAASSPSPAPTSPPPASDPSPIPAATGIPAAGIPTASPPAAATPTPFGYDPEEDTFLDNARRLTSSFISDQVFQFDSWFGDADILEAEIEKPWFRVRAGGEWEDYEGFKFRARFRAVVPLPGLENRLGAYLGSEADDQWEDDEETFEREDEDSGTNLTAGLRYTIRRTSNFQFSSNIGVRVKYPPVFYIQPRLQYSHRSGPWFFRPIQYFYYYTDGDLGETTKVEISRYLGRRFLLRSYSRGTYSNESRGVDLSQNFSLQYLNFDVRHGSNAAVELELESNFSTWPSFKADRYQINLRLYHTLWRPWLRISAGPQLIWKRVRPGDDEDFADYWRKGVAGLYFYLEVLFEEEDYHSPDRYNPYL